MLTNRKGQCYKRFHCPFKCPPRCAAFRRKYFTLAIWRWGIQAMCCAAIASLFSTVPTLHDLFKGNGVWVVQTSMAVLEPTAGACIKKSAERILGTVVGGLSAYLFVLAAAGNPVQRGAKTAVTFLAYFIISPFFWGWIRVKFPNNILISIYGLLTSNLVAGGAYVGSVAFQTTMVRIVAVVIGVIVNTMIVHLILPVHARDQLVDKCINLLTSMSEILEPVVELQAGLEPNGIGKIVNPNKKTLREIAWKRRKLVARKDCHKKKQEALQPTKVIETLVEDKTAAEKSEKSEERKDEQSQPTSCSVVGSPEPFLRKHSILSAMVRQLSTSVFDKEHRNSVCVQSPSPSVHGTTSPSPGLLEPDDIISKGEVSQQSGRKNSASSSNSQQPSGAVTLESFQQNAFLQIEQHRENTAPMVSSFEKNKKSSFSSLNSIILQSPKLLWTDHESSICRCPSNASQFSTFFRQQESELEVLKGRTFRDLATEYARQVKIEETQRQERWSAAMKTVEKCQQLLGQLPLLLLAARQELKVKGPTVFPSKQYQALVTYIQRLFHQIASLFFCVDCQLAQVSQAKFESFLALGAQAGSAPTFSRFAFSVLDQEERITSDPQIISKMFAGIAGAFLFTEAFGAIIGRAVSHICEALKQLARALSDGSATTDAVNAIGAAADDIWLLCSMRNERSMIYLNIFGTALKADAAGHWVQKKVPSYGSADFGQSSTTFPWEKLIGLDAETFRDMSKSEHKVYWESYWRARDRLSVATGTLMLLRDQLYVIRAIIDSIVNGGYEQIIIV